MKNILLIIALLSSFPASGNAVLTNSLWGTAARKAGVHVSTLYSIALQESGMRWPDNSFRPWPWTLNINLGGIGPRRYRNKQEAEIALTGFINAGIDNIDIGLMQVNLKWHGKKVSSPLLLLDPATNIMVASSYLEDINTREPRQAVADYHSPTNKQRGINYVNKVIKFERLIRE